MRNLHTPAPPSGRQPPPVQRTEVLAVRNLSSGEVLYHQGDSAQELYRVDTGLLKLSLDTPGGRERIVALAGPGDVIGMLRPDVKQQAESAVVLGQSASVSLLADSECSSLRLEAGNWQLQQLRDMLEDLDLPVPARLARVFSRLGRRFGHVQQDGNTRLTLPLTHDSLAAIIGAARETTSTTLAGMRRDGVLSGTRGSYTFNPRLLADFAVRTAANSCR